MTGDFTTGTALHPADWYADPWVADQLRYWDGQAWTRHIARRIPTQSTDPFPVGERNDLQSGVGGSAPQVPLGDPAAAEPGWHDLATNKPGQAVLEKAEELRRAAPVKTFVARVLRVHTDERAFRVGASGEVAVGRRLQRLGEGWHVIHSVPVGDKDTDIDHVVIGPPGVFTVNTKNHSGRNVWVHTHAFKVSGHNQHYLRKSRAEAKRAAKLLSAACGFSVPVEPIIVVLSAKLTVKGQPRDVSVGGPRTICRWLTSRPPVLSPEAIEDIYEHARRDVTWRPRPARTPPTTSSPSRGTPRHNAGRP